MPSNAAGIAVFYLKGCKITMFVWIKTFFAESRQELRHVNWPTRQEAVRLTTIVIGMSIGIAVFLGFFDYLFTDAIKLFVVQ